MPDLPTISWFLVIVLGTIVLGVAIGFGMWRSRQRTARERAMGEQATHDLYEEADRERGP